MKGKILCCASLLAVSATALAETFVEARGGSVSSHVNGSAFSGSTWGLDGRCDIGVSAAFLTATIAAVSISEKNASFPYARQFDTNAYGAAAGYAILSTKDSEAAVTLGYLRQDSSLKNGIYSSSGTSDAESLGLAGYMWFSDRVKGFAGLSYETDIRNTSGYAYIYDAGLEVVVIPSVRLVGSYRYYHDNSTSEEGTIAGGVKIPFGKRS
jgi:hypothetical protein